MEGRGKHEVAGSGKHEALLMLCASELAQLYTIIAADKVRPDCFVLVQLQLWSLASLNNVAGCVSTGRECIAVA